MIHIRGDGVRTHPRAGVWNTSRTLVPVVVVDDKKFNLNQKKMRFAYYIVLRDIDIKQRR